MTVAVVGAGSFIARALRARTDTAAWRFVGHARALAEDSWLVGVDTVVNCAFDPRLRTGVYDPALDVDRRLAERVAAYPGVRYVMTGSRLAYGPAGGLPRLVESLEPSPDRYYGIAKLAAERALRERLGDRVTVLRIGNVFGLETEPGRASFFGIALRTLRETGRIVLDVSPFVERDFIPVEDLAERLVTIATAPRPGVFNLGSGTPTAVGRIALWLIEGYGSGTLCVTDPGERDAFALDLAAVRAAYGIRPVPAARIRSACVEVGRRLRSQSRSPSLGRSAEDPPP